MTTMTTTLGRVWRRFGPAIRRERTMVAASFGALALEIGLRALEPWPLKYVFDRVLTDAGAPDVGWRLAGAAVALVAVTSLRAMATYWNTLGFSLVGNRVMTEVRDMLYRHLQRLSLSFHSRAKGGDLVVRVSRDVDLLKEVAVTALLPLFGNVAVLLVMAGLMLWLHWGLALVALGTLPLFAWTSVRLVPRIHDTARSQRKREGAVASAVAESMGAIRVVQALSLEERLGRSFQSQNQGSLASDVKTRRLSAALERSVDGLVAFATALVLGYGGYLVVVGRLTPGGLLVFLSYLKSAFRPMQDVAKYTGRIAKAAAAGERIVDLLDRTPDVADLPGAVPAPRFAGGVRLEGVSFRYAGGRTVLHDLSLEIPAGTRVALVGPSGTGKTTLASLLLRLIDPTAGRVLIDGRDIREFTLASLRAQISVVLQDTLLFATTIRENIALGAGEATDDAIVAAAHLANAHQFIEALPEGYQTVVGERGVTLSSGQRQRIAIARAAIRRSPIVILDEPTTGLDRDNATAVIGALRELTAGCTTLIITHDRELAATADLVIRLDRGQLHPAEAEHALVG